MSKVVPATAGILLPPANVDALAQSIAQLLNNSSQRKQLQSGAQQAAHYLPEWKHTAKIVYQLIQKVIQ